MTLRTLGFNDFTHALCKTVFKNIYIYPGSRTVYKMRTSMASCDNGGLETISQSKHEQKRFVKIIQALLFGKPPWRDYVNARNVQLELVKLSTVLLLVYKAKNEQHV